MRIYFVGSIRGGRDDKNLYKELITHIKNYGEVLTEHIGEADLDESGESSLNDKEIHDRDMSWLLSADVIIAEVSTPSLGVGYELGRSIENNKPVLCLFRKDSTKRLSAMIAGSSTITNKEYSTLTEAKELIDIYIRSLDI